MGGAHPWTFKSLVWYWSLSKWPAITHWAMKSIACCSSHSWGRSSQELTQNQGKQKPVKLPTSLYTSFHVRSTDDFSAFFFFNPFITPLIPAFTAMMSPAVSLCSVLVHLALYRAGTVPKTPFPYCSWSPSFWHILFPSSQLHADLYQSMTQKEN